jgi:hypothetical protein
MLPAGLTQIDRSAVTGPEALEVSDERSPASGGV